MALYASWLKKENTFVVKVFQSDYTCCRSIRNRQTTTRWITDEFVKGKLRGDGCTTREIQQEIMGKYTLEVPLMKCYKSKWFAEKIVHRTIEEHFMSLRSYIAALHRRFSGSTFELMIEQSASSGMYDTFKRLYICFKPLLEGFNAGCKRVVGFDETFIKHKVGGIFLTVVGRDGNEGMYPIVWAVVERENTSSWSWFFELLFKDLNVGNGAGWTFISEQQKGLLNAVCIIAPYAEHRNCSRHIYQSWKVKHIGLFLNSCFYKAVKSTNEADFSEAMHEMRFGRDGAADSFDAAEDFMKQGPKHFCKAFFKTSSKCGTVSNNMCETFNSFIIIARRLPMIKMLERIRKLLMVRQVQKSKLFARSSDILYPVVRKEIENLKEASDQYVVRPSLMDKYEVSRSHSDTDRFVVDLSGGSCICRSWDLIKVPCAHAIACIHFMKRNVEDYVDDCYKKGTYESAYAIGLEPLEGQKYWPSVDEQLVKPPPYKKLPGRLKKNNRRKSKEEEQKTRVKLSK